MEYTFSDKSFFRYLGNIELAIFAEYYYFIQIGTITYKFIFAKSGTHKTIFTVHVKLHICKSNFRCFHPVKLPDLSLTLPAGTILLLQLFKPGNCVVSKMFKIFVYSFNIVFKRFELFVRFF